VKEGAYMFGLERFQTGLHHRDRADFGLWLGARKERGFAPCLTRDDATGQNRQHLGDFVAAYNFGRRLKTLKGLTAYEAICKAWQSEPARFTSNPHHQMPGPNS
jgi:hypothetical protein